MERSIDSGITMCGQARGQRLADRRLGSTYLVGEVREFCPLPSTVGMGWWSASWTHLEQVPPVAPGPSTV